MIAWGTQKTASLVGAHCADTSLTKRGKKNICEIYLRGTHSSKQRLHEASSSTNNIIAQLRIVNEQVLVKGFILVGLFPFQPCVCFFYIVQPACSIGKEVIIIPQL